MATPSRFRPYLLPDEQLTFDWYQFKLFAAHLGGFSMDSLHVVVEVALQLGSAALLRRSLAQWWPWLTVLGLELLNEANDLLVEQWPDPGMQWGEGARDLLLTMALPTLLLLVARRQPSLLTGRVQPTERPQER